MVDDDSLKTFEGHTFIVSEVVFFGKYLVSASRDMTIKFWNIETGKVEKTIEGEGEVRSIDAQLKLVASDDDNQIRIWNAQGELLNTIKTENTPYCVRISKWDTMLYGTDWTGWKEWDINTGELLKTIEANDEVLLCLAVSRDLIATGDATHVIKLYDRSTGKLIKELKGHTMDIEALAFTSNGFTLISGSDDGAIKAWDVKTGENIWTVEKTYGGGLHSLAISPDDKYIVSGGQSNDIHIRRLSTGIGVNYLDGHTDTVFGIAFSPDNKHFASCSEDQTIKYWKLEESDIYAPDDDEGGEYITDFLGLSEDEKDNDEDNDIKSLFGDDDDEKEDEGLGSLFGDDDDKPEKKPPENNLEVLAETKTLRYTIKESKTAPKCIAVSKTGKYLAYGCYDSSIKLFNFNEGIHKKSFLGHESEIEAISFLPNEEYFLSCSIDQTVRRWNIKNGKQSSIIEEPKQLTTVVVSPDGQSIIFGSGARYIKVVGTWLEDSVKLNLQDLSGGVNQVIISPDGKHIIAGLVDNTVRAWEFLTGEEIKKFEGHKSSFGVESIAISRNMKYLVGGGGDKDMTVKVWDYQSGELLKTIKDHLKAVNKVAISPYGKYFASCSTDSNVHVYEFPTFNKVRTYEHEGEWINSVIFSADGQSIISSTDDRVIRVWKFPEGKTEKKEVKSLSKVQEYLKKAQSLYDNVSFAQINKRTQVDVELLHEIIEDLIFNGQLEAKIKVGHLIFRGDLDVQPSIALVSSEPSGKFKSKNIHVLRGGDWKVEGSQSVFYYKVKVKNDSKFLIGNIQVILTSVPRGLDVGEQIYKIESLKPGSFESPTFKLMARESCVGDTVEGIVTYTDPMGSQQTVSIEPFDICYVCNLLTPKEISKQDFDKKVEFMEDKKLIIDSDLDPSELEERIANIINNCNFAMLQQLQENKTEDFQKFEAFAEGLYDKQDVALSIAVKKVKGAAEKGAKKGSKKGSKIVIKAMSDREEKVIDLLKDFNVKLDDIKSDTELIKEYSAQLENIFDKTKDLETFLIDKLGSDFQNIKHAFQSYKAGEMTKAGLVKEGLKMIGKKFIKKIIGSV